VQPALAGPDGYLRLSLTQFRRTALRHLWSGLEAEEEPVEPGGARVSAICGYTEWVSDTRPALSVGWDWRLGALEGRAWCLREGDPFSNIMLIDARRRDLGPDRTARLLGLAVDRCAWQAATLAAVSLRYAAAPSPDGARHPNGKASAMEDPGSPRAGLSNLTVT